ncbi:Nucleoid occlusion protein (plasmid) [Piscirickettsia salmonis]|uniref:ParB n=2 Tax=Piscirickettsia salmonis TaxID=1238 RepID=A0A7H0ZGJ1_PISSA|nr:ParB/RepB/Spo0J family partition protein [Piscirickettsia salmonis]ALB24707.1 ParB [Piscirickettsia salmonis]ALY04601.1 hypothetical protein AWE47_16990 [Piscirickettsia salmonis]AMA44029.1 hypothetical protein AWJ11_16790 [Piscirickettsia salmonis]AOS36896.1 hypothetical protein AVM72_16095 [Piscirickettsia salmonis]APS62352.1 hypothetical protein AVI53_17555 [Piscirickettsia salmonis]
MSTVAKKNKQRKNSSKREQMLEAAKIAAFQKRDSVSDYKEIIDDKNKEIDSLKAKVDILGSIETNLKSSLIYVDPAECVNWLYADRQNFELGDLQELAEDIEKNGQVQPCILRLLKKSENQKEKYEVIAGERRWRACSLFRINLLAEVRELTDAEALVVQKSENRKKDICPHSEARQYYLALKNNVISQNELAAKLGYSSSSFSNLLSFMHVDDRVWKAVGDTSRVSPRSAKLIKQYCDKGEEHIKALISIAPKIKEGMGAKSLEKTIDRLLSNPEVSNNKKEIFINNKKAFSINGGDIKISKSIYSQINMDELEKLIYSHLSEKLI